MWRRTFGRRPWPGSRHWPARRCWDPGQIGDGRSLFDAAPWRMIRTWCRSVSRCRRPQASAASPSFFRPRASCNARPRPCCAQPQGLRTQAGDQRSLRFWPWEHGPVWSPRFLAACCGSISPSWLICPRTRISTSSGRCRRVSTSSLVFSIAQVQRDAPLRIDGEVVFADGCAVNWRELWNAHRTADRAMVLAKTMEGVRLLDIASLPGVGQHA
jgi:Phosphoribosyl-dephospho-CoA transferase MdcG